LRSFGTILLLLRTSVLTSSPTANRPSWSKSHGTSSSMRRVILALAIITISSGGSAVAQSSVQNEVTSLVRRAVLLANTNFESLMTGRKELGNDQVIYYPKGMLSSDAIGDCELFDRPKERLLHCFLAERGTLKAATAFYLPAIEHGVPSSYKAHRCTVDFGPAFPAPYLCKEWTTETPHYIRARIMIIQGDGGTYVGELEFRVKR